MAERKPSTGSGCSGSSKEDYGPGAGDAEDLLRPTVVDGWFIVTNGWLMGGERVVNISSYHHYSNT